MSKRSATSADSNPNNDFCEFLLELSNYERNVNKNIHKYNAYKTAAATLSTHPVRIKSGEEARKLKGVGDKISKKIDEFLNTGKLQKLENIHRDEDSMAISLLTRVSGIGPSKAHELVSLGIKNLEDLENHKDKLTHHQKIGLKYFYDFEKKIPRDEIEQIESIIRNQLSNIDPEYQITICGSFRRQLPTSGDIDVLVTHPSYTSKSKDKNLSKGLLKDIVKKLEKCNLITETLSLGETKYMGACRLPQPSSTRRLDIRLTPHDQYACSVLYFTGSATFNQRMRQFALEQGFTLNEYSLRPIGSTGVPGEPVPVTDEKSIFDYIDFPYTEPEKRIS